jgi:DNA-binding response OmpR family regulator
VGDVALVRLLLADAGLPHHLNVVRNGDEAMSYLAREGRYEAVRTPDLILIDLGLPKLNGFAVLEQVNDLRYKGEPVAAVAVWSGSDDPKSKEAAQVLGADEYFVKAAPGTGQYRELVKRFRAFWDRLTSTG